MSDKWTLSMKSNCILQPHQGETNSCGMFILYEHDNIIVLIFCYEVAFQYL